MSAPVELLAVYWEWAEGAHQGARFWGCHDAQNDARIRDWPALGLKPIGAATVIVAEGQGLDLLSDGGALAGEAWSYSINYGPDEEANYANVYDGEERLVGNLKIHHAVAVVNAMNGQRRT